MTCVSSFDRRLSNRCIKMLCAIAAVNDPTDRDLAAQEWLIAAGLVERADGKLVMTAAGRSERRKLHKGG